MNITLNCMIPKPVEELEHLRKPNGIVTVEVRPTTSGGFTMVKVKGIRDEADLGVFLRRLRGSGMPSITVTAGVIDVLYMVLYKRVSVTDFVRNPEIMLTSYMRKYPYLTEEIAQQILDATKDFLEGCTTLRIYEE